MSKPEIVRRKRWFKGYARQVRESSTVATASPPYACPCCRHLTLTSRGGFDICAVCFWEDDGQDDQDADTVRGGPNGRLSLTAARENYRLHGACNEGSKKYVRPPTPAEVPPPGWMSPG